MRRDQAARVTLVNVLRPGRPANRLLVATLLLCLPAPPRAQAQYPGAILGTVSDARTRLPLEGVSITLVQTATVTLTDAAGRFQLHGLAPGLWTLRAERLGYAATSVQLNVQNGAVGRADIALEAAPLQLAALTATAAVPSSTATRLDRNSIEEAGARTAGDALRSIPGIVVQTTGPNGGQFVSIRGAPADATLVLVDGVPLNDPVTGEADLSRIDAATIASITILRAAASARFGARAAAGVVLIETLPAGARERQLMLATGSLGARRIAATWADGSRASWTAGAAWSEMHGEFSFELPAEAGGGHGVRKNAGLRSFDAFAATTLRPAGSRIDVRVAHESLARGLPGRAYAPTPHARQRQELSRASAAWRLHNERSDASVLLALVRQQIRHQDSGPPAGTPYHDTTRTHSLEFRVDANRRVAGAITMGGGAQLRHQNVRSTALEAVADIPALDAGAFIHGDLIAAGLGGQSSIAAQLRADRDPARRQPVFSHSITAAWTTTSLAAHLAHRSAFSPPTLGDRFFREGVGIAPNPDLRAERVPAEIEAGLRWTLRTGAATATLRATAFQGNVRDMILWAPDFRFVWSPYNANAKRNGIEAALQLASRGDRLRIDGAASFTRATYDRGNGDDTIQIVYRPRFTAAVRTQLAILDTRLSTEFRYTGARNTAPTSVNRLPGFHTLDAALSRELRRGSRTLTLDLRVDRILDETDALIFGFPEPGRRLSLGLRFSARPPPS